MRVLNMLGSISLMNPNVVWNIISLAMLFSVEEYGIDYYMKQRADTSDGATWLTDPNQDPMAPKPCSLYRSYKAVKIFMIVTFVVTEGLRFYETKHLAPKVKVDGENVKVKSKYNFLVAFLFQATYKILPICAFCFMIYEMGAFK